MRRVRADHCGAVQGFERRQVKQDVDPIIFCSLHGIPRKVQNDEARQFLPKKGSIQAFKKKDKKTMNNVIFLPSNSRCLLTLKYGCCKRRAHGGRALSGCRAEK